ncbi:MAG: DUF559 domain-containing protein [bacterium]
MAKIYNKVFNQILFLRPELQRKLINFIDKNSDIWNEMEVEEQQKFIDAFQKSGYKKENKDFIKIGDLMPSILERIKRQCKISIYQTESPIEDVMVEILLNLKIEFECQKKIGKYRVDFLIQPNIIIECDGKEYHRTNLNQILNDCKRDRDLIKKGFIILRYSGYGILNQKNEIIKEIKEVIRCHQKQ